MTDEDPIATGGCLCGAVRFEAVGRPIIVLNCHCESCRRHSGAPMVTLVSYKAEQLRFTAGARQRYSSSPGVERAFCGDCGTTLTWESAKDGQALIEVHVGCFDAPDGCRPDAHVFHGERLAWFDTADHLPRYREGRFGAEPYRHRPARL